ncbi:unnamed protein product [Linum tenue]|uniref:Uncharacterized protein n=1 Tax=Linum tenue TaxID=586396 RepID=A0AAV0Q7X2_9ROSI|nr:unnamed protein product [Linum tenue]
MDSRLANTWRLTVNEKKFIETALASDLRIDGRKPLEYRKLTINFGRQVSVPIFRPFFFFFSCWVLSVMFSCWKLCMRYWV